MRTSIFPFILLFLLVSADLSGQVRWYPANGEITYAGVLWVAATADSTMIAGGAKGIYRYDETAHRWRILSGIGLEKVWATPDGILLGRTYSQVFRSVDGGREWSLVDSVPAFSYLMAEIDGILVASSRSSIYRSVDSGATWSKTVEDSRVGDFLGFGRKPSGEILALGHRRMYSSSDSGISWQLVRENTSPFSGIVQTPQGKLIAANDSGLFASSDYGETWSRINGMRSPRLLLAAPDGGIYIYRMSDEGWLVDSNGLYRSTDDGVTWDRIVHGHVIAAGFTIDGTLWINRNLRLLRSMDRGITWEDITDGLSAIYSGGMVSTPGGEVFALIINGYMRAPWSSPDSYCAMWKSSDFGISWQMVKDSLQNGEIWADGNTIYSMEYRSVLVDSTIREQSWVTRSTDLGRSWKYFGMDSSTAVVTVPKSYGGVVAAIRVKGDSVNHVIVSADSGTTWKVTRFDYPQGIFVTPDKALLAQGSSFSSIGTAMYRSEDFGKTWTKTSDSAEVGPGKIEAASNGFLFSVSLREATQGRYTVHRSTDDGRTWASVLKYFGSDVMLYMDSRDYIYIGHGFMQSLGGVRRSTDYGVTWQELADGLLVGENVRTISFPRDGEIAGLVDGIPYIWTEASGVWKRADSGLDGREMLWMVALGNGRLMAAPFFGGFYTTSLPLSVEDQSQENEDNQRENRLLVHRQQSGEVLVRFTSAIPSPATVKLFDLLGREISLLHDGISRNGIHEVTFNASDISRGAYLITLECEGAIHSRMISLP